MVRNKMILAFDTATYACTVAVGRGEKILAEKTVYAPRQQMERLLPLIDEVLKVGKVIISDIEVVTVGLGPGSFTGIRIGVATAKGLAQALDTPLVGVSTLDVLAYGLLSMSDACLLARQGRQVYRNLICPVIDAKRGQVYFAVYGSDKGKLRRLTEYQSLQPEDFCRQLRNYSKQIVLTGDALEVYQELFRRNLSGACEFASSDFWFPKASNIIPLAVEQIRKEKTTSYFELFPLYVRIPIAEENWQKGMSEEKRSSKAT